MTAKTIIAKTQVVIPQSTIRAIPQETSIDRVILVVSKQKADERLLSPAIEMAQKTGAELAVVYLYKNEARKYTGELALSKQSEALSHTEKHAQSYLQSVCTRLKTQYSSVVAFLHDCDDVVSAVRAVADGSQYPCVILPKVKKNGWLSWLYTDTVQQIQQSLGKVVIEQVEV